MDTPIAIWLPLLRLVAGIACAAVSRLSARCFEPSDYRLERAPRWSGPPKGPAIKISGCRDASSNPRGSAPGEPD